MAESRKALTYALVASLLTAWIACPSRYLHLLTWTPSIFIALEYVVIVLVASLSGAASSYGPRLGLGSREMRDATLRSTAVAIWSAPLVLLMFEGSSLAGVMAAGIAAIALLGVGSQREEYVLAHYAPATPNGPMFRSTRAGPFARRLAIAIATSALLQSAVVAHLVEERELAVVLLVIGAGLLAARWPIDYATPPRRTFLRHAGVRLFLSVTIAMVFVVIGLFPLLMRLGRVNNSSWYALLRGSLVPVDYARSSRNRSVTVRETPVRSGGYVGVILTPKPLKHNELVIPAQLLAGTPAKGFGRTLTIPFTGSYWFFQYPFRRPPLEAVIAEGDPAKIGVHSSNYDPLLMEAVQALDRPIDSIQLEGMQIELLDADPRPGTVSIEVVLADAISRNPAVQSLGIQRVRADSTENTGGAHLETLAYVMPSEFRRMQINRIRLIFRLDGSRSGRAAAMAIKNFVLVPRGQ